MLRAGDEACKDPYKLTIQSVLRERVPRYRGVKYPSMNIRLGICGGGSAPHFAANAAFFREPRAECGAGDRWGWVTLVLLAPPAKEIAAATQ